MGYSDPDLIYDENAVAEQTLLDVADRIPGWQPQEGSPETSLAEAFAIAVATAAVVFRDELQDRYADGFGANILGRPRKGATAASATSTWTLTVSTGMTIPGGANVTAFSPAGTEIDFVVAQDVVVPAGATTADVLLVALDSGPEPNGTSGDAQCLELINVDTITIGTPAAGGADAEDVSAYLDEIADRAQRLRALPITPGDFAAMALDVPGVERAYAVNRYDPSSPGTDSPGHVTVFALDGTGGGITAASATGLALSAYYGGEERLLQVIYHVAAPATTSITVAAALQAEADADPDSLAAAASAAISSLFDNATWDLDARRPNRWRKTASSTVTAFQVAAAIDDLAGLRQILSLTVNGAPQVILPAPLTLPALNGQPTITVTT